MQAGGSLDRDAHALRTAALACGGALSSLLDRWWGRCVLTYDSRARATTITHAVAQLVDRGGITAVTMRTIAAEARLATGSITGHLGCKERVLVVAAALVREHLDHRLHPWVGDPLDAVLRADGSGADTPADGDAASERAVVRAWLALREAGRTTPSIAEALAVGDDREATRVTHHLGLGREHVALVAACLVGLRDDLTRDGGVVLPEAVDALSGLARLGPGVGRGQPLSVDTRWCCPCSACATPPRPATAPGPGAGQRARPREPFEG